jgi:molybdopterin-guanine dinucleotide biosynthesis protein A
MLPSSIQTPDIGTLAPGSSFSPGAGAPPGAGLPAVILAGGRGLRMGGADKVLLPLRGARMIDHVLAGLRPQCGPIALNANGAADRFAAWGLPVLPDPWPEPTGTPGGPLAGDRAGDKAADMAGPLAGVLAAMLWAAPLARRVLTWPGDTPHPPADLVARLTGAGDGARVVCAASGGRAHPVIAVWPVDLAEALTDALRRGVRRVTDFTALVGSRAVAWPEPAANGEVFANVNTPEDLRRAEWPSAG